MRTHPRTACVPPSQQAPSAHTDLPCTYLARVQLTVATALSAATAAAASPALIASKGALLLELRNPPAHLLSLIDAAHLPSQVGDSTEAPPLVSLQARQPVRAARVHTTAVRPLRAGWPRGRFARVARGPAPSSGCAATRGSARQARRGLGRAEASGAVDPSHTGDS